MTAHMRVELLCDGCPVSRVTPCHDETEARGWAYRMMWRVRDELDYCPQCAAPGERVRAKGEKRDDVRVTVIGDTAVISGPVEPQPLRSWQGKPMTPEQIRRLELMSDELDELLLVLGVELVDGSGSRTAEVAARKIVARVEARVARQISEALEIPPLASDYEAAMRAVRTVAETGKQARQMLDAAAAAVDQRPTCASESCTEPACGRDRYCSGCMLDRAQRGLR